MGYRKSIKFTLNTQGELTDEFVVSDFMSASERAKGSPCHVYMRGRRRVTAETFNYTIDLEMKMYNPDNPYDPADAEWFQLGNIGHSKAQSFSTQTLPFHGILRLRAEQIVAGSPGNAGVEVYIVIG